MRRNGGFSPRQAIPIFQPDTQSPLSSVDGAAQVLEVNDDREEATLVASRIRVRRRAGTPLSEMAILFRTARQGRTIERALV